ncbi:PD-(D/E)XK nuclease-like domain-containing protein [Streptomyces sp. NPDC058254]|uniref:PD-(D/E)XK nuclease-like domain-containing protein n=1 Tax=Streptomyces sp. NPDC058254 TaxID=3346406 RepID=UPI0036EBF252
MHRGRRMTAAVEVEAPRIVDGLSADEYHADRTSISSSGLRALLNPGCPAQFKYDRDNPQAPKKEFDLGHAAHKLVLGEGDEIVVTEYDDWRTKAAREERDAIRADGAVPLLFHDGEQVHAMAEAIRQHPLAGPLFTPGTGVAEQSIFWTDPATGVRCRIRPDWLKQIPGLTLCVDYKTTRDASPDAVSKAINDHGYHQQDALYTDGTEAAGLAPDGCRFLFVFQSKTAPYLITVREIDQQARDIGRAKNERALRIYADCERTGIWPDWTGPVADIPFINLPTWAAIRDAEEYLKP